MVSEVERLRGGVQATFDRSVPGDRLDIAYDLLARFEAAVRADIVAAIEAHRDKTLTEAEGIFDDVVRDHIEWQAEGMTAAARVAGGGGGA